MISYFVLLPCLVSAFLVWVFGKSLNKVSANIITVFGVFVSFASSCFLAIDVILNSKKLVFVLFDWIQVFNYTSSISLFADSVSCSMMVVVTLVSLLVHVYSVSYMSEDKAQQKFMAFLSLFTFFMLVLVTGKDILQTFIGWEGVGVSSYLLIGFWYKKESANKASIKAFITNRVADFAFLIGIVLIYFLFGTLDYSEIFSLVPRFSEMKIPIFGSEFNYLSLICFCLFVGCMGKSAQIGLHVWLADAMEGPTPVSALIHAATMVTAGVFLLVRCSPMFEYAPSVLSFITVVGAVTAIFAASIAITQTDIKRIIAYSTCSQLGYMFFACGVSAYSSAMFHLITHAFFKALLFLSAGSVIHSLHHNQDITKMGGIWKKIPITFSCFMIGSLAIGGVFPFAGYYSKDAILEAAYLSESTFGGFAFVLGLISAFLTSMYSWRLIIYVFHGKTKLSKESFSHVHESPLFMVMPLVILAILAVISGFLLEHYLIITNQNSLFWNFSIFAKGSQNHEHHILPFIIKYIPLIISVLAIACSYFIFFREALITSIKQSILPVYRVLFNKYYVDEIYQLLFVTPLSKFSSVLKIWDKTIVDALCVHGVVRFSSFLSVKFKYLQSGYINIYTLSSLVFIVGFLGILYI